MIAATQKADFLRNLCENHSGRARVELDIDLSELRFTVARPTYVRLSVKLFLGRPVRVGEQLLYPVELPAVGTFDAGRDGDMDWGDICQFVLERALEMAHPGASTLLARNTDGRLAADRMRLLLTGACEGPLSFDVEIEGNRR